MFCACVKEEYLSADILTAVKVKRQFFDNALTNNVTPNGEYVVISEDTSWPWSSHIFWHYKWEYICLFHFLKITF